MSVSVSTNRSTSVGVSISNTIDTITGLKAGTYTLQTLLQNLVNQSHKHSKINISASDTDGNCDCCGSDS